MWLSNNVTMGPTRTSMTGLDTGVLLGWMTSSMENKNRDGNSRNCGRKNIGSDFVANFAVNNTLNIQV